MSAFPRVEAKGRQKRKRRAGAAFAVAASIAAILLAVGSAVLWWRHESSRAARTSAVTVAAGAKLAAAGAKVGASANSAAAISVAQSPAAPAAHPAPTAAGIQARDPQLTDEHVGQAPARAPTSPVVVPANTGFALLGPDGDISDLRPEFSWQPLAGAVRYRVVVVDAGLRPVQRSPLLRKTAWRPRRALRRGRTYLWQVTATLRGGSKVVASAPGKLTER
jgi:hypothetical protein